MLRRLAVVGVVIALVLIQLTSAASDKYQSTLKGCGSSTSSKSTGSGDFTFDTSSHKLSFVITHNVASATNAVIYASGVLVKSVSAKSPVSASVELSWNKWNSLWNGSFTVVIQSSSFNGAKGEISGRIGCVGNGCAAPPARSAADPCAAISNQQILYDDAVNTNAGWSGDWGWEVQQTWDYTADKRCGAKALHVKYTRWEGFVGLHMGLGNCDPGKCTQSWNKPYIYLSSYAFLEFSVRNPAAPLVRPILVKAEDSKGAYIGQVFLTPTYVDNYMIEDTWTRVKIPLSSLGFKGNELFGKFILQMQSDLPNYELNYDNIRLVPSYNDPYTKQPVGTLYSFAAQC